MLYCQGLQRRVWDWIDVNQLGLRRISKDLSVFVDQLLDVMHSFASWRPEEDFEDVIESFSDFRLFVTTMVFSIIQLSVNVGYSFVVIPLLEERRSGEQRETLLDQG